MKTKIKENWKIKLKEKLRAEKALKEVIQENIEYQIKNRKQREELEKVKEELCTTMETVTAREANLQKILGRLEEIAVGAEGANQDVNELSTFIEEVSSSTHENASTIAQISGNINSIKNGAESLYNNSKEGMTTLQSLLSQIGKVKKDSGYIGSVLKLIVDINERIKLLSINALIEAAHAGNSGRGFQVVADEIRELSENTTFQMEEAKKNIKNILQNINESVVLSNDTQKKLDNIKNQTNETANAVTEISVAINEQTAITQQISNTISSKIENIKCVKELIEDIVYQNQLSVDDMKNRDNC